MIRHPSITLSLLAGLLGVAAFGGCEGEAVAPPPAFIGVSEDPSDNPVLSLTDDQQRLFDDGDAAFEQRYFPAQGLGPLYIRTSCARCHAGDGKGPGFVQRMILVDEDGTRIPDAGTVVRPFVEAGAETPLLPPDDANIFLSTRIGPAVFGRGFMEAITDEAIEAGEAAQANRDDGISGRIHRVTYASEANTDVSFHQHTPGQEGLIGRFGVKARIASLDEFTADAFQGDMGLTSPMRPTELPNLDGLDDDLRPGVDVDLDRVNAIAFYMRALRIPTRTFKDLSTDDVADAEALFAETRCAVCHTPTMPTAVDWPIVALAGVDAAVFTDMLIHDMGHDLRDEIVDGDAGPREWRTAPLMGLRFFDGYLHDGRASTIREAIAAHASEGSEANDSVERFDALSPDDAALLITYVESL